jgi:hypothetical protein
MHYSSSVMVERAQPFSLRVSEASSAAYKKAAEEAGLSVSEWARLVLDSAAGVSKIQEQLPRQVVYVDVSDLSPKEALALIERTRAARKVRDGKW